MNRNKERNITSTEKELWDQVVTDVKSLSTETKISNIPRAKKVKIPNKPHYIRTIKENIRTKNKFRKIQINEICDTDKRTFTKLKRGKLRTDATLDLHGLTLNEAYASLKIFLACSQEKRLRCVLIITGKGIRNPNGTGIIKSKFPEWLNEVTIRPLVKSVSHAHKKDGGDGAFYVLIRKRRK